MGGRCGCYCKRTKRVAISPGIGSGRIFLRLDVPSGLGPNDHPNKVTGGGQGIGCFLLQIPDLNGASPLSSTEDVAGSEELGKLVKAGVDVQDDDNLQVIASPRGILEQAHQHIGRQGSLVCLVDDNASLLLSDTTCNRNGA